MELLVISVVITKGRGENDMGCFGRQSVVIGELQEIKTAGQGTYLLAF